MSFSLDLGSLSLDLGDEFQDSKTNLSDLSDDPLETKLDLAEEEEIDEVLAQQAYGQYSQ